MTIVGTVFVLLWSGIRIVSAIQTDRKCIGRLKRAADASTVKLAESELGVAIDYIERNNLTSGSTAILWDTPATDLEFWYSNIKSAAEELRTMSPEATQLERTNVLMKLRETLLDDSGQHGVKVTKPGGISVYPHNTRYCVFGILSFLLAGVGVVLWILGFFKETVRRYY